LRAVIEISIPNGPTLELRYALVDFNGTLARDGRLIDGVDDRLRALAARLAIHVATGNTTGTAPSALAGLPVELHLMPAERQAAAKRALIETLGARHVAAIGNGRNDREMLERAALAIAIVGGEGFAADALAAAGVVCTDVRDAIDLLLTPMRLVATLRG
jgi:soluble P-type ATPase